MPKPQTKTRKTTPRPPKPMAERVVKAAGRRPQSRDKLAAKLGVHPNGIARALGQATAQGKLVKTDKGYQKAL